jgi:lipopolysaccharide transport system permease protein
MISKVRTFLAYRELLWVLTLREIQIRYKQSVLGIVWAVLQPLAMMLAFTLIFSSLLKVSTGGIPYPIFSYSALLLWTLFSNSLTRAIPSLEANSALIRKIYLPREFFPMSSVLGALFDFLISAVIFVGLMIYYHNFVHLTPNVLYVIPILLIQMVFTFGLCFFASAVNVYYRDIKHALPFLIQIWMFATPIIYPVSLVPERFQLYYFLNPMAGIIVNFRLVVLDGAAPSFTYLGISAAGSVLLFIVGYWYFKRVEMDFADVV